MRMAYSHAKKLWKKNAEHASRVHAKGEIVFKKVKAKLEEANAEALRVARSVSFPGLSRNIADVGTTSVGKTRRVDLDRHSCSCMEYGRNGWPCRHAATLIIRNGLRPLAFYVDKRHLVKTAVDMYAVALNGASASRAFTFVCDPRR